MDPAVLQGYITLIGLILNAGIQTEQNLRIILGSHVTPADLDVILGQVQTRLARRGITT